MYDSHILDMVELGIEHYKGLKEFKTQKVALGIKPCLLFAGELFEVNNEYKRIKSLLIDMFRRETVQAVRLQGLEHVLMFTAAEGGIYFRSYRYDTQLSFPRLSLPGESMSCKTPWSESVSELYRLSDRRLSAKLLPTFVDRGCHVVSVTDPYGRIIGFLDRSRYFSIK
jgi:hypothetical protein